tara:strand:- start:3533 stop:3703 length:171 start_codon:yes stop_codon:yes gene_type:complete
MNISEKKKIKTKKCERCKGVVLVHFEICPYCTHGENPPSNDREKLQNVFDKDSRKP